MDECRLSVIIASFNSRETIGACLRSLEFQEEPGSFEIIVVDSSSDGTSRLVAERFPKVKLLSYTERKYCGDARNIGISRARGEIIAFIDADCIARPDWIREILRAHQSPDPAIGGAIASGNPESLVGWGAYFTEFSKWMPGGRPGYMTDIAAANMSYKKRVFREYGSFIEGTYCSDTEFHWRLERDGLLLKFDPSIVVSHRNIEDLASFLKHEVEHGQSFARVRRRAGGFSGSRRIAYSFLIPLVAAKIFLGRVAANLENRCYLWYFLKSLPLVLLGVACWSAGEFLGYAGEEK